MQVAWKIFTQERGRSHVPNRKIVEITPEKAKSSSRLPGGSKTLEMKNDAQNSPPPPEKSPHPHPRLLPNPPKTAPISL
jgi:hypothetical protein